jgi:hypothetical protein
VKNDSTRYWYLVFPLFLYATHFLFRLGLKQTVSIKDLGFLSGNYCVTTCPIDKRELEKIPSVLGGHLSKYLEGFYKR